MSSWLLIMAQIIIMPIASPLSQGIGCDFMHGPGGGHGVLHSAKAAGINSKQKTKANGKLFFFMFVSCLF
jgi:hypothetical protein